MTRKGNRAEHAARRVLPFSFAANQQQIRVGRCGTR